MLKAKSSFFVLLLAALFISLQSYAQSSRVISHPLQISLRMYEQVELSELLKLNHQQEQRLQLIAFKVNAKSFNGPVQLDLLSNGRRLLREVVRKQVREISFQLPAMENIEGLVLESSDQIVIESISAEVIRERNPAPIPNPNPYPGQEQFPAPNSLLTVSVNEQVYGRRDFPLKQLVKQQLGLSLNNVEIERVVVDGDPMMGRYASVQVEINNRLVGPLKYLSTEQRQTPLPVNSLEPIRTLQLVVQGEAFIRNIRIRVGQTNQAPIPVPQRFERVFINHEVLPRMALDLGRFLPYEQRFIRAIAVNARASRSYHSEMALTTLYGQLLGRVAVTQIPMRAVIQLFQPLQARDIRIQALHPVLLESLELQFDR